LIQKKILENHMRKIPRKGIKGKKNIRSYMNQRNLMLTNEPIAKVDVYFHPRQLKKQQSSRKGRECQ